MSIHDLRTPCLLVDADAFEHNVATMAAARPGRALRPHVKAFKSTGLAGELAAAGHDAFCCATPAEMVGMASVRLGNDLLLANQVVDRRLLTTMVSSTIGSRLTVAVDSPETISVAAAAGVREVLVDVAVGMPRCGCSPARAAVLADEARAVGLEVRGVMGYEGHLMGEVDNKAEEVAKAMALLLEAHDAVGGEIVSGGGTGTWDLNTWVTELQAGSYTLMDGDYARQNLPFRQALTVWSTVISVNHEDRFAVADAGIKAIALDHGNPAIEGCDVWYCSDEHTVFSPAGDGELPDVGDRIAIRTAHVDPTVASHDRLHVVRAEQVIDTWPVDLRGWEPIRP